MKRGAGIAFLAAWCALPLHGAQAPATVGSEPAVELPPMIVAETARAAPWLYARVGREEYLSRCSASVTRSFIQSRQRQQRVLRALVPDDFLAPLPTIMLLYDADGRQRSDDQVAADAQRLSAIGARRGDVRVVPNLRVDDRDRSISCVYIAEALSSDEDLVVSVEFLRLFLERRTPMLPPWFVEGILGLHAEIHGRSPPTVRSLTWSNRDESTAFMRDSRRPRTLLSGAELFAPDVLRGAHNQHPERARILQARVVLFVRWALDPRNGVRQAFWKFAARAAEERVTDEMFAACFGFGLSDLRDRLSDYLPAAIREPYELSPTKESVPRIEVRPATSAETLRIRLDWERLVVNYVQRRHPTYVTRYLEQARATLRRAGADVSGDPSLRAAVTLAELECGDRAAGIAVLADAAPSAPDRPRLHYELARDRFARLLQGQPPTRLYAEAELTPVFEPLRAAAHLSPRLPEIPGLLADAWLRCERPPGQADTEILLEGARSFALHPTVAHRVSLALVQAGRPGEALNTLELGVDLVPDEALRGRYLALIERLRASTTTKR